MSPYSYERVAKRLDFPTSSVTFSVGDVPTRLAVIRGTPSIEPS